jgi:hypothetical protein
VVFTPGENAIMNVRVWLRGLGLGRYEEKFRENKIDFDVLADLTDGDLRREGVGLKSGAFVVREWNGRIERVMVLDEGYAWNGGVYRSLSQAAKAITGTNWNGHRFFGLKGVRNGISRRKEIAAPTSNAALDTGVSHPRQAQAIQEIRR